MATAYKTVKKVAEMNLGLHSHISTNALRINDLRGFGSDILQLQVIQKQWYSTGEVFLAARAPFYYIIKKGITEKSNSACVTVVASQWTSMACGTS